MPGIVLIALQDDTKLLTYGWNVRLARRDDEKMVTLSRGDMLICRGDLVYCGMEYSSVNILLHCYLDVTLEGASYVPNKVLLCSYLLHACRSCNEEFETPVARRLH